MVGFVFSVLLGWAHCVLLGQCAIKLSECALLFDLALLRGERRDGGIDVPGIDFNVFNFIVSVTFVEDRGVRQVEDWHLFDFLAKVVK